MNKLRNPFSGYLFLSPQKKKMITNSEHRNILNNPMKFLKKKSKPKKATINFWSHFTQRKIKRKKLKLGEGKKGKWGLKR